MFFLEVGSWIAGFQEDDKGADWGDFRQVRQQWGRQDEQGGVQAAYGIEKELNMTLSDSKHPNISSSHHFIFKVWQSRTKRLAQIRRLQNVYKVCKNVHNFFQKSFKPLLRAWSNTIDNQWQSSMSMQISFSYLSAFMIIVLLIRFDHCWLN